MKKIKDFKKWWKKKWNTSIHIPPPEGDVPNMMIFLIISIYATLFFICAAIGGGTLYLVILCLNEIYPYLQMNEISWMFIGLVFGIAASFFVQAFPQKLGLETPATIWKSFKHRFFYFLTFFSTIIWWEMIAFMILLKMLPS